MTGFRKLLDRWNRLRYQWLHETDGPRKARLALLCLRVSRQVWNWRDPLDVLQAQRHATREGASQTREAPTEVWP